MTHKAAPTPLGKPRRSHTSTVALHRVPAEDSCIMASWNRTSRSSRRSFGSTCPRRTRCGWFSDPPLARTGHGVEAVQGPLMAVVVDGGAHAPTAASGVQTEVAHQPRDRGGLPVCRHVQMPPDLADPVDAEFAGVHAADLRYEFGAMSSTTRTDCLQKADLVRAGSRSCAAPQVCAWGWTVGPQRCSFRARARGAFVSGDPVW